MLVAVSMTLTDWLDQLETKSRLLSGVSTSVGVDLDRDASDDCAGLRVEDDYVTGAKAGAAIGGVEPVFCSAGKQRRTTRRLWDRSSRPDRLGFSLRRPSHSELVDGRSSPGDVFCACCISARNKECVAIGRPGHAEPGGLKLDVLDLLLCLRVEDVDSVRQVARVAGDNDSAVGRGAGRRA